MIIEDHEPPKGTQNSQIQGVQANDDIQQSTTLSEKTPLAEPLSPPSPAIEAQEWPAAQETSSSTESTSWHLIPSEAGLRFSQRTVPPHYQDCCIADMVVMSTRVIEDAVCHNDQYGTHTLRGCLTPFHSRLKPGIAVGDYLVRIASSPAVTPGIVLSMLYYMDRLSSAYHAFLINSLTVHRFLITAATVASKGLSDVFFNTRTYAQIGGLAVAELRRLVREFLHHLNWRIVPSQEVLEAYYQRLVSQSQLEIPRTSGFHGTGC